MKFGVKNIEKKNNWNKWEKQAKPKKSEIAPVNASEIVAERGERGVRRLRSQPIWPINKDENENDLWIVKGGSGGRETSARGLYSARGAGLTHLIDQWNKPNLEGCSPEWPLGLG